MKSYSNKVSKITSYPKKYRVTFGNVVNNSSIKVRKLKRECSKEWGTLKSSNNITNK